MISAIIVAYNEGLLIESIIHELKKQQFDGAYEIILADGGSSDNSIEIAMKHKIKTLNCRKGKAKQINDAAKAAKGDILFFVHADMKISDQTFTIIQKKVKEGYSGGGFSNEFDEHNGKIKKLGTLMNFRFFDKREQSDKGIFYGDNGIFVKNIVFEELNGFKEIAIMEDYDFSERLRSKYKVVKVKEPKIIVSARRHIEIGFLKTRFQWIMIRKLYKWGIAPEKLARWYREVH